jgi:hypothetical protein
MNGEEVKSAGARSQIRIDFTDKPISAWGGIASLVARYVEKLGFRDWVEENLPISEVSPNGRGRYEKVLGLFLTVLTGGDRFSHMGWWGHGKEIMCRSFGVEWLPQSPSVMTRFWNKVDSFEMAEVLGARLRSLAVEIAGWEGMKEDELRFDSSVVTRYGRQEGAVKGYNPKKHGRVSQHPLIAFLGSGYIVNLWNRSGNSSSGNGIVEFFRQTVRTLEGKMSVTRILADTGYYLIGFVDYLERNGYSYIISAPMNQIIQRRIFDIKDWAPVDEGIEAAEFHFRHLAPGWDVERRYVVIRQEVAKRPKASGKQMSLFPDLPESKSYRYSVMMTNETMAPVEVWRTHRPRATVENVIDDMKDGYGFASFSLHSFWATEAVMSIIGMVFRNLIVHLNRNILHPDGQRPELKTLRLKMFIVPAILGSDGRRHVLRLGVSDQKLRSKIVQLLDKISLMDLRINCNAFGFT